MAGVTSSWGPFTREIPQDSGLFNAFVNDLVEGMECPSAPQGNSGGTIHGGVPEMTQCHGLVDKGVLGQRLDSVVFPAVMIL